MTAILWPANDCYLFAVANAGQKRVVDWDQARGAKVMDLAFPEEIRRRTHNNQMFLQLGPDYYRSGRCAEGLDLLRNYKYELVDYV